MLQLNYVWLQCYGNCGNHTNAACLENKLPPDPREVIYHICYWLDYWGYLSKKHSTMDSVTIWWSTNEFWLIMLYVHPKIPTDGEGWAIYFNTPSHIWAPPGLRHGIDVVRNTKKILALIPNWSNTPASSYKSLNWWRRAGNIFQVFNTTLGCIFTYLFK